MSTREFDVVVYGATGYTGRLVAEYLAERCAAGLACRWAMAGRSQSKLEAVRDEIGAPSDTLVVADAADPASVQALAARAKVMLTTVGPYQLYGGEVVAGLRGSGYGLCGPVRRSPVHARHHRCPRGTSQGNGGPHRILHGLRFRPLRPRRALLQNASLAQRGKPFPRVKGRVRSMNGTFSGGTLASGMATMAAAQKDPQVLQLLLTPWALTPGFEGPAQPSGNDVHEDPALGAWVAPFVMAAINTRNIHRSNQLLGHPYGVDFAYDEMMVAGPGDSGKQMAEALASTNMMAVDENSRNLGKVHRRKNATTATTTCSSWEKTRTAAASARP